MPLTSQRYVNESSRNDYHRLDRGEFKSCSSTDTINQQVTKVVIFYSTGSIFGKNCLDIRKDLKDVSLST